jgi:hypothetical protein
MVSTLVQGERSQKSRKKTAIYFLPSGGLGPSPKKKLPDGYPVTLTTHCAAGTSAYHCAVAYHGQYTGTGRTESKITKNHASRALPARSSSSGRRSGKSGRTESKITKNHPSRKERCRRGVPALDADRASGPSSETLGILGRVYKDRRPVRGLSSNGTETPIQQLTPPPANDGRTDARR